MIGFSDLDKAEEPSWFSKNKKMLMTGGILLGAVAVGYFVYTRFMVKSGSVPGYSDGGSFDAPPAPSAEPVINME